MKVLLLNTKDGSGGAGIAARRLLHALNHNGIETEMIVRNRETSHPCIHSLGSPALQQARFIGERLQVVLHNGFSRKRLFDIDPATQGADFISTEPFRRADVIHLHWVNQGFLSLRQLRAILHSGKRVVWTLHDMWPITGICHHSETCERWKTGCHHCPLLVHPGEHDLSWRTFRNKRDTYAHGSIQFVACSDWLADLARKSPLTQGGKVHSIPNPIDTQFYAPGDPALMRRKMNIPDDHRVLLFVAYKATDERKGIGHIKEAIPRLLHAYPEWRNRLSLIFAGREASLLQDVLPCHTLCMDYVANERRMRELYQVADLLLMPTLMDNLPNTVMESMSCGTPCVAFRVGGLPQMINHGENGYLANYRDSEDLMHGIASLLHSPRYPEISASARHHVLQHFSESKVARRFAEEVYHA